MKRVPVNKGKYFAIVDNEDYDWICKFTWTIAGKKQRQGKYARTVIYRLDGSREEVYMHRMIMKATRGTLVDHLNMNGLDNRKSNLRLCTTAQNSMNRKVPKSNRSGYKGVYYRSDNQTNPYDAKITFNGKRIHIGCYRTAKDASDAYYAKAKELFGDFARLR